MDDELACVIQDVINSRAKLDVLYYFHRNPHTWESLEGLARRLDRAPQDLEAAVHELTRQGLLTAFSGRLAGADLVYNYCQTGPNAPAVCRLLVAYDGNDRKDILQRIIECDHDTRLRMIARRRTLDDLRTRFVSMVTHELRTPVTVIRSVLATLDHENLSPEQRDQLIHRGVSQCDRLNSLIENLFVLSGLQSGRALELYCCEVELPRLISEIADQIRSDASPCALQLELTQAPSTLCADEYLLGQVIEELIRNAVKFSPQGTPVTVTVTADAEEMLLVVDDVGIGMSTLDRQRVFEPFYQAEEDSSRLVGGLGIGLYMARKIAEAHGGRIWIEPKSSPGLQICLALPLNPPAALD